MINQSLHCLSAISFLLAYAIAFKDPAGAALIGWLVSMTSRQLGHFFFEPKGYDEINQATHEHKEDIKVGYNLRRKVVLLAIWGLSPIPLWFDRTYFGLMRPLPGWSGLAREVGQIWLALGVGGLLFRTVQLFFVRNVRTGLVWATKILTDPFHDLKLYGAAPIRLIQNRLHRGNGAHAAALASLAVFDEEITGDETGLVTE